MKLRTMLANFFIVAGAACVAIWFAANLLHAQPTVLSPFQTNLTVGTSATLNAVPANPSRRGLIICNGNATAANNVIVGFGSNTPTTSSGLIIPGGNVAASCFYAMPITVGSPIIGMGAQINLIAVAASTPVTILEF